MDKWNAIAASVAFCMFWVFVGVILAQYLGVEPLMSGNPINPAPAAIAGWLSFWVLRKSPVLGHSSTLSVLDKIFQNIFPEHESDKQRGVARPHRVSLKPGIGAKSSAERAGNFVRDYVINNPIGRPKTNVNASSVVRVHQHKELDEDALYEQAFNELQGGIKSPQHGPVLSQRPEVMSKKHRRFTYRLGFLL